MGAVYGSTIAIPLLVTGHKITRGTSGRELGDAFRVRIERVEEGECGR